MGDMTLKDVLDTWGPHESYSEVEAWAYGTERECPGPTHNLPLPATCPTCHGTGKVREAGLVERVREAAAQYEEMKHGEDWDLRLGWEAVVVALRNELGDPDA